MIMVKLLPSMQERLVSDRHRIEAAIHDAYTMNNYSIRENIMKTQNLSISIKDMVNIALFTAVLCAIAPISINIGPIPLSFATLVIYLASGSLGWKYGLVSVVLYILLGSVGLPVFSNFRGGFHIIVGATGGFIVGYIPLAFVTGLITDAFNGKRLPNIIGMVIGTIILYTCGVAWYMFQSGVTFAAALMACVTPFLIGDSLKIIISSIITPQIRAVIIARK
jgi:biotin transport system substrate-specific component